MGLERILTNLSTTKARRIERNGREYLVAPMTILVPGVLAGSEGPLYYPAFEVAKNSQQWNDVPITLGHPTDVTGNNVSGRSPSVLDNVKLGRLYNVSVGKGGKLKAEGWFDVERTRRADPRVYAALVSGKPLELSTGLYTDNLQKDGTYNGRGYTAIARNYRPDHLAILPDQVGACSLKDGCGVFNRAAEMVAAWIDYWDQEMTANEDEQTAPSVKKKCSCHEPGYKGETCDDCKAKLPTANYENESAKLLVLLPQLRERDADAEIIGLHGGRLIYASGGKYFVQPYTEEGGYCTLTGEATPLVNAAKVPSGGLDMTPEKACQILRDKQVHGKPLTEAQRGMFGAKCGQRKKETKNVLTPILPPIPDYFQMDVTPTDPDPVWEPV